MGIRFQSILGAAAAAVAIAAALPAAAQQVDISADDDVYIYDGEVITIPAGFRRLFYNYSGDFYENRTINRQITFLFGRINGRFAEREIVWDANAINEAYEVHMALQNNSTPLVRVPDMPNPYGSSLLTSPDYVGGSVVTGSEFIYEFTPMP